MSTKILALFIHLVWATEDRSPLISPPREKNIYRFITSQVHYLGCKILAINGLPDHIHLVIKIPSTLSVAEIVKKTKGGSSRLINQNLEFVEPFRWQAGYAAFTVSRWDLHKIIKYVRNQKRNHTDDMLYSELETIFID